MIVSMLLVCRDKATEANIDVVLRDQRKQVERYLRQRAGKHLDQATSCVAIGESQYEDLRTVGLGGGKMTDILDALERDLPAEEYRRHMVATMEAGAKTTNLALRVIEVDHPDGFPYLAVSFMGQ